jgi:hypothetical protein
MSSERFQCPRCLDWIRDKWILGTLHVCLTDEEFASKLTDSNYLRLRRRALENYPKHLKM